MARIGPYEFGGPGRPPLCPTLRATTDGMMVPLEARTPNAHAWREACLPVNGDGLCVVYPSHTGIQYISSLRAATANWFRSLSQHENVRSYTCGPEKGTGKKPFLADADRLVSQSPTK
jgi:hypothetical protein